MCPSRSGIQGPYFIVQFSSSRQFASTALPRHWEDPSLTKRNGGKPYDALAIFGCIHSRVRELGKCRRNWFWCSLSLSSTQQLFLRISLERHYASLLYYIYTYQICGQDISCISHSVQSFGEKPGRTYFHKVELQVPRNSETTVAFTKKQQNQRQLARAWCDRESILFKDIGHLCVIKVLFLTRISSSTTCVWRKRLQLSVFIFPSTCVSTMSGAKSFVCCFSS